MGELASTRSFSTASGEPLRILISGVGIAGPTLAYWLARHGMHPTLVERAPALRTGGYVIDFWGAGFDIADRMGLLPVLHQTGYMVREVRVVDGRGRRIAWFPADAFTRVAGGRFVSLPRGDLAAAIFGAARDRVDAIFGDSIEHIDQNDRRIRATFASGRIDGFDLLVGADGLHSTVRRLLWGPDAQFERYLGYKVAAFDVAGYRPRDELVYVMYTEVGRQVARFTLRGDRTMFLFIFADPDPDVAGGDREAQKSILRRQFGTSGWECPRILEALDSADELYFDRVSQIRIPGDDRAWARGRVTLLGDAASCVSFLGGQGSALAMIAAYILAGELHRAPDDCAMAFARYKARFGPFVRRKQDAALRFATVFAPPSRIAMFIRNRVMNLLSIPGVTSLVVGREFTDSLDLPEY